jgi:hypothetical protein
MAANVVLNGNRIVCTGTTTTLAADIQAANDVGGWGRVTNVGGLAYRFASNTRLDLGDGITVSNLTDTYKTFIMEHSGNDKIRILNAATVTFGNKYTGPDGGKYGQKGCRFYAPNMSNASYRLFNNQGYFRLYGCKAYGPANRWGMALYDQGFSRTCEYIDCWFEDFYRIYIYNTGALLDKIRMQNCYYGFGWCRLGTAVDKLELIAITSRNITSYYTGTFQNFRIEGSAGQHCYLPSGNVGSFILQNGIFNRSKVSVNQSGRYVADEIDLNFLVLDEDDDPLEDAQVKIYWTGQGSPQYTKITGADGKAQQMTRINRWDVGSVRTEYNPLTITCEKSPFLTQAKTYTMEQLYEAAAPIVFKMVEAPPVPPLPPQVDQGTVDVVTPPALGPGS